MKHQSYILAAALSLSLGCNTFADPSFVEDDAGVTADSGTSDAGNGMTTDSGSTQPDASSDAGELDDAAGSDAGDAGIPPLSWVPSGEWPPSVRQSDFDTSELRTCGEPVQVSSSFRGDGVDIVPIDSRTPRFAIVSVTNDDTLAIYAATPDSEPGAGDASVVSRFTSNYSVLNAIDGDTVSVASMGRHVVAAAIDSTTNVHVSYCVFTDREQLCRTTSLEYDARAVEVFVLDGEFHLITADLPAASLMLRKLQFGENSFSTTDPVPLYGIPEGVETIDVGFGENGRPIVATGHEIGGTSQEYFFGHFWNGSWAEIPLDEASPPTVEPDSRLRVEFRHFNNSAWILTDDNGGLDSDTASIFTSSWGAGNSATVNAVDFDLKPIGGGFIELFVNSLGGVKIVIDTDEEGNYNDPNIQVPNDDFWEIERPSRVAALGTTIGVAHRGQGALYFSTVCQQ